MTGSRRISGRILNAVFLILIILIFTSAVKVVIAGSARSPNGPVITKNEATKQSNIKSPKKKKKSYVVQWESPTLMHLYPPSEMKLSIALRRARLHLPVYRIGVAHNGFYRVALVHFWAGKSKSRKLIEVQALRIIMTAFRTNPSLSEVDVVAISQRQTEEFKPDVLFSVMAERKILPKIKYNKFTPYWILHQFGMVRYSPELNP